MLNAGKQTNEGTYKMRRSFMNNFLKRATYLGCQIRECYRRLGVNINISKVQMTFDLRRYIFKIEVLPGVRVKTIFTCAVDVQIALRLYLFYPFREGNSIFIVVSEFEIKENRLLKILRSTAFTNSKMQIPLALGYDLMGNTYITDLAKLLHLLIVGPSGTGKSVALQSIVISIIVRCPVESVRLILFDIGADSLTVFKNVKHLYHPIVKDVEKGVIVLKSLVDEMDKRISLSEDERRNLPFCVCIIDEFDDTVSSIENKEESKIFISSINSIIRRGRKAKIILILASHDPTSKNTKVKINGIMSRVVFKCASHYNSSSALGSTGAENLSGGGAMLFKAQDMNKPVLLQGSFITSAEIVEILKNEPVGYDNIDMLDIKEIENTDIAFNSIAVEKDRKELADILFWVLGQVSVSVLQIQKKFKIGNRAKEIMEMLHKMNIVTKKFANQPRTIIPTCIEKLSGEAVDLLEHYGYDAEQIREIFEAKAKESDSCI